MKLRFTPRAARDLAEIADYIREHSPEAALRVRAAILESLQSLALFPHIGRQQKVAAVRKLVTRRYPIWSITLLTTRPRKLLSSPSSIQPASANIRIPSA
jgi:plasmid stabilization system protein ParE